MAAIVQRLVCVPEGKLGNRYLRDKLPSDGALPGAIRGRKTVLSHAVDAVRRDGLQDGPAGGFRCVVRDHLVGEYVCRFSDLVEL